MMMLMRKHLYVYLVLIILLGYDDNNSGSNRVFGSLTEEVEKRDPVPTRKAMPPLMDPKPTLPKITDQIYFDMEVDGQRIGRIVIGLFGEVAPKAVRNFIALSECNTGASGAVSGKPLCYKNTPIHRAITNFMIQGGDVTHGDGTGGESIYDGGGVADDADLTDDYDAVHFNRKFLVAMVNRGGSGSGRMIQNDNKPNYGSQFFITVVKTQWLDNQDHLIIGTVIKGEHVVKSIESYGTHGGKIRGGASIVIANTEHKNYGVSM